MPEGTHANRAGLRRSAARRGPARLPGRDGLRILLDSHAFLWWLAEEPRLSAEAVEAIADPGAIVHVSAASIWEISIKAAPGRIDLGDLDLVAAIGADGFVELPVSARHALVAGRLPRHHDDPFDRMLVAQANVEHLVVVTHDPMFGSYDVPILST